MQRASPLPEILRLPVSRRLRHIVIDELLNIRPLYLHHHITFSKKIKRSYSTTRSPHVNKKKRKVTCPPFIQSVIQRWTWRIADRTQEVIDSKRHNAKIRRFTNPTEKIKSLTLNKWIGFESALTKAILGVDYFCSVTREDDENGSLKKTWVLNFLLFPSKNFWKLKTWKKNWKRIGFYLFLLWIESDVNFFFWALNLSE